MNPSRASLHNPAFDELRPMNRRDVERLLASAAASRGIVPPAAAAVLSIFLNAQQASVIADKRERDFAAFDVCVRFQASIRAAYDTVAAADHALVDAAFARTHELCLRYGVAHPQVTFGLRGSVAGEAWKNKQMRINLDLYRENTDEFIRQVVPHELCHLWHVQLELPGSAHGREWKRLMKRMGVPPDTYHTMEVVCSLAGEVAIHKYACACPAPHRFVPRQHAVILRVVREGKRGMLCRCCNEPLVYKGLTAGARARLFTKHSDGA